MAWLKHRLRDAEVWARVDDTGALVADGDGRVEIVYKPVDGAKVYRAGARNLTPVAGDPAVELAVGAPAPAKPDPKRFEQNAPADAVHIWTDGGCKPNPGPCGIGVVFIDGKSRIELSEYLGEGTNNIAELTAIVRGLEMVEDRARPVFVYSDSQLSINLLTLNWKPKVNVELVMSLRALCKKFSNLKFVKVLAHSGITNNERVDQLANMAMDTRTSSKRNVTPLIPPALDA